MMYLYCLNPNAHGDVYFTMAADKKEAFANILKYLRGKYENESESGIYKETYRRDYMMFLNTDIHVPASFPGKYTLDQHPPGTVLREELC